MDKTKYLETWNEAIKSQTLGSMAGVFNRFLLINFLCTWVWSEFIYKVGYVDIDTVIQLFIQKWNLFIVYISKLPKIENTCDDCLQESKN